MELLLLVLFLFFGYAGSKILPCLASWYSIMKNGDHLTQEGLNRGSYGATVQNNMNSKLRELRLYCTRSFGPL